MEICHHCHNVLSKNTDRCTVCGVERADPTAGDVRRRDGLDPAAHAPGWAAPLVESPGIHPEDFLRELSGEQPIGPASTPEPAPVLPPREIPATPPPGALAGYLGATVQRQTTPLAPESQLDTGHPPAPPGQTQPAPPAPTSTEGTTPEYFGQHLSTATNVTPDGVAARTTRLDGTVKLGPTAAHQLLTIAAPLIAAAILAVSVLGAFAISGSEAEEPTVAAETTTVDLTPAEEAAIAVARIELDGCGVVAETTGFVFADQSILSLRSEAKTDNRPTIVQNDGAAHAGQIVGWSQVNNIAVIRSDTDITGGLQWGVSGRLRQGDGVSVLSITSPGVAEAVPAVIADVSTRSGTISAFELDVRASEGSVVLDGRGFVVGVVDSTNSVMPSDGLAPLISRIRLSDDRPDAECPPPPTTVPPTTDTTNTTEPTG